MKQNLIKITAILMIGVMLGGCTNNAPVKAPEGKQTIKVYYGDANNEKMTFEEREITYTMEEDKYKKALEELFKGPESGSLRNNLGSGIKVTKVTREGNDLTVDLSKEFGSFAGIMAEIMGVGGVVNTMTQFEEVARVKILVEGEELIAPSGEPRGFMETFPIEP